MFGDIQAQGLVGFVNAQAAAAQGLNHKNKDKVENQDDDDGDHNTQNLSDQQRRVTRGQALDYQPGGQAGGACGDGVEQGERGDVVDGELEAAVKAKPAKPQKASTRGDKRSDGYYSTSLKPMPHTVLR